MSENENEKENYLNKFSEEAEYSFGGIKTVEVNSEEEIGAMCQGIILAYSFNY